MPRQFEVHSIGADGKPVVEKHDMSPEMERSWAKFQKASEGFWCTCEHPTTGRITPRGHSVDVDCGRCGKCLQVG